MAGRSLPFEKLTSTNERSLKDIGDFIFIKDDPVPSDIILVPGSQENVLAEYAASLWREGFAPRILVSGKYGGNVSCFAGELRPEYIEAHPEAADFTSEAQFLKSILLSCDIPESAVITEEESRNTFENAIFSGKILREKDCRSMLLVCQAFHARRALMTFSYILPEITIRVCPVVTKNTSRENWTESERSYRRVMGELRKCGDYFCREDSV